MTAPITKEVRELIVQTYQSGQHSIKEICEIFKISKSSLFKFVTLSEETDDLTPKKQTGRPPKIEDQHLPVLLKMIKSHPDYTLSEYCQLFFDLTGIEVGTSIMDRAFAKYDIRYKKKLLCR